ncbi:hypothetical protein ACFV1A_12175 [Streptomyces seoulensis]|uniref:DUF4398 domain-containing protein n=1 Tax=Streptomyces seoulensis TaxID=73044 RepID=A0A4P6TXY3_STRSO|nr:hypothetical protein [Streptomyces seoulensis]QBJ92360.1 hypothetical protein D0Z67_20065 [Streptomyces seoulensis]
MRRGSRRAAAAVTLAALAALTTGCGHDDAATPSSGTATPSGYADMKKKVDAAESAAAAADRDATSDADR